MDLRALKYFIAVYEQKSFSAAAKSCFVAQPSISSAISQLESTLNVPLFARHARGVAATEHAEKLYPLAKGLHGQADAIKQLFTTNSTKQEFKLGVTRGLGVKRMSLLLKDFTAATTNLALTLVPPYESNDCKIITKEELSPQDKFMPLWQEDYLLAMPHSHVLSLKESLSISDFDNLAMIHRSPCHAWRNLEDTLAIAGIQVDIRARIQTIDYAIGLVSAGIGCALLPAYPEVLEHKTITFRPIEDLQLTREIMLAYQAPSDLLSTLMKVANKHK